MLRLLAALRRIGACADIIAVDEGGSACRNQDEGCAAR